MSFPTWDAFLTTLEADHRAGRFDFLSSSARFQEFVKTVPDSERIPLLLHAYERYRASEPNAEADPHQYFWSSAHSILISTILKAKLNPSESDACAILTHSFHFCGHGCDVEPPLDWAEKAFRERPYSIELFDAVEAYRETLRPVRSIAAQTAKRKLEWISWHDPRHSLQGCWTARMRSDIEAMAEKDALHWQLLLRNTAGGLNTAPGKAWLKEGTKRLAAIGEEPFLKKLDSWFAFPSTETVRLSPAGSCMLRLLVWYGSLVNVDCSLPILVRVADVQWHKREPAQKIVSAVAWLLRTRGDQRYEKEIASIGKQWASDSGEAAKLQEAFHPQAAAARETENRQRISDLRTPAGDALQDLMLRMIGASGLLSSKK